MLVFCGCPAINSLVNNIEMKLIRVNREYGMINPSSKQYRTINLKFNKKILKILNEAEQLNVDEGFYVHAFREENPIPAWRLERQ